MTSKELTAALHAGLPEEWGPWQLTGSDVLPTSTPGNRMEQPWAEDELAFDRHDIGPDGKHRTNIWIWSSALTRSHPSPTLGMQYERHCSFNGFLAVQHATEPIVHPISRRPVARDLSVVDAVYTDTGELLTYPHYLSAWRRVASRLRKIANQQGPAYEHPLCDGYPWSEEALSEAHALLADARNRT